MDKGIIMDAYSRGLLSKDECTQLLGIDPNILLKDNRLAIHGQEIKPFSK